MKIKLPPPKKKSAKRGRTGLANVKKARAKNALPRKKNGTVLHKKGTKIV